MEVFIEVTAHIKAPIRCYLNHTNYKNYSTLRGGGGGGSPLKFWKTRFRDNGRPKRYTQWTNFLVGFVSQEPYGAAVVATPIFRPKLVHFLKSDLGAILEV